MTQYSNKCPMCGTGNNRDEINCYGEEVIVVNRCLNCDVEWQDVYLFSHVHLVDEVEGVDEANDTEGPLFI